MRFSISNTGQTITMSVDPDAVSLLNQYLQPERPNQFSFGYKDGYFYIQRASMYGNNRTFTVANKAYPNCRIATYPSKQIPNLPIFKKVSFDSFSELTPDYVKLELPTNLTPTKPRTMRLKNKHRPGAIPGKFKGWTSEEKRQASIDALARARQISAANRARRKQERQAGNVKTVQIGSTPQPQPNLTGTANLIVQIGNKVVSYQIPEDELYEYAFELSEKGYRLK